MLKSIRSIRMRLAVATTSVILAIGSASAGLSYAWLTATLEDELQRFALHEAQEVANLVASLETRDEVLARQHVFDGLFPEEGVVGLGVFSLGGELVHSVPSRPGPWSEPWPAGFRAARAEQAVFEDISGHEMPRSLRTAVRVEFGREPRWLVVAIVSRAWAEQVAARYRTLYGAGLAVALGAGFLGSLMLITLTLRPLRGMVDNATKSARGEAGGVLEVPQQGSELVDLAVLLNRMLERDRRALESLRLFTSHAGHELRTPLARLRSEAEMALRQGDATKLRESIAAILDETGDLERVVEGLLDLARVESSELRDLETFALVPLLEELAQQAREVGAPRQVELRIRGDVPQPAQVRGNRVLLERALWNLLDNAIKFGQPQGRIEVRLARADGDFEIEVADDGHGVSGREIQDLFEPFQRGESMRRAVPGHGLGLSLARAVVRRHGGDIEASRDPALGGACFRVRLPAPTG